MVPPMSDSDTSAVRTSSPAPLPVILPQYTTAAMEQFECLAERCDDTCCRDWAVPISRDDLSAIKATMSSTEEGRQRLTRLVVIGNHGRTQNGPAQLRMNDAGACPMLENDNRCGLHSEFGEQALTTPCSVFPRTALALSDRVEVGGSLGCPEVARLTLLPDATPSVRPATKPMLPRAYVGKTISDVSGAPYTSHFLTVRGALLRCFQHDLALGTQFVLAADFAERLQPFFHAGTSEFQGARRSFSEQRLQAEIGHTESAQLHLALDRDLAGLKVSGAPVTAFVRSLLVDRKRLPHSAKYATLVDQVVASLGGASSGLRAAAAEPPSAEDSWESYAQRREALRERMGIRFDAPFRNYCHHFLMRNPYTDAGTLSDYLYKLGMQLGAVRLLTVGHPDLAARLAAAPNPTLDRAVFDAVVVHVVQTFTKAISHHPEYLEAAVVRSATSSGGISFGQHVLIAKFL